MIICACLLVFHQPISDRRQFDRFVENRGQWPAQVRFLSSGKGADLWITESGARIDFHDSPRLECGSGGKSTVLAEQLRHQVFDFVFPGITATAGRAETKRKFNYLLGKGRHHWTRSVPQFETVASSSLSGISVSWTRTEDGFPRFDLHVSPGSDPRNAVFRIKGVDARLEHGEIVLATNGSVIRLGRLRAFQCFGNETRSVDCAPVKKADGSFGFRIGRYDESRDLTIDPTLYCTYLGGTGSDAINDLVVGESGSTIVCGVSASADFPTSIGSFQESSLASVQAFVSKFDEGGNLVFSTFLGGSGGSIANTLAVTPGDNTVIVAGSAGEDFPTTPGSFQPDNAGAMDGFVATIKPDGTDLLYSTYLGGSADDAVTCIERNVGSGSSLTVAGNTSSNDFPIYGYYSAFSYYSGGSSDGFVASFGFDLSVMSGATYWGGSGADTVTGILMSPYGSHYVIGSTDSYDFPAYGYYWKPGPIGTDATLGVFAGDLTYVNFSTCFGGSGNEWAQSIASSNDCAFIGGVTASADFPTGPNPMKGSLTLPADGFLIGVDLGQEWSVSPRFSTYLDGDPLFTPFDSGDSYIAGPTRVACDWTGYPVVTRTSNATKGATGRKYVNLSVIKLTPGGNLTTKTVFLKTSSTGVVQSYFNALDLDGGVAHVGGNTSYAGMPVTPDAFAGPSGGNDGLLCRLSLADVDSVRVSPKRFPGGIAASGQVFLTAPAQRGGTTVFLKSSQASVTVPKTVTVAEGEISISFSVMAKPVSEDLPVTITAYGLTTNRSTVCTVIPPKPLDLKPDSNMIGGVARTMTLSLEAPAAASGQALSLSCGSTLIQIPSSVVVPAGQRTVSFEMATSPVVSSTQVVLRALSTGSAPNTAPLRKAITLLPNHLTGLTINPSAVKGGDGTVVTGTITLAGLAPIGGLTVALSCGSGFVSIPPSVIIPGGSSSGTFTIGHSATSAVTSAAIVAQYLNSSARSQLVINP
jgi:hypothetical protein